MTRPLDPKHEGTTEFEGAIGPAGVSIKGREALSAAEKLRLGYATGGEDSEAPVDPHWWEGTDPAKWEALRAQFPPVEP